MEYYFSNRIELLYERLKKALFQKKDSAFARRTIIVPSPAVKSWLLLRMANDPEIGIAMGLQISYLDQTIDWLYEKHSNSPVQPRIPSALKLSFVIEVEIRQLIARSKSLSSEEYIVWQPLLTYLKAETTKLSQKGEKRMVEISEKLGSLFVQYGTYGEQMVLEWERDKQSHWQAALWETIHKKYAWSWLALTLSEVQLDADKCKEIEIYLFSMSFISKLHHRFLQKVSDQIPIHFYLLSPCQAFWSDIHSDKEKQRLLAFWIKQGVSEEEQKALEEYLRDRNPLLANFGKLGREMTKVVEESDGHSVSDYQISSSVKEIPQYEEYLFEEINFQKKTTLSVLDALQADLLTLRHPESCEPITLSEADRSIQVHAATDRMRETQILYDNLLGILNKQGNEKEPFYQGDIIVMAPDIMVYEPYIKAVFGGKESKLDFQIMDLHMTAQGSVAQAFLHLISLPFTRWDVVSILGLFNFPAFQKQHKLSAEDVNLIRSWVLETEIRWGQTGQHRNEILLRDHCKRGVDETIESGTWEGGLSRLVASMTMTTFSDEQQGTSLPILPLECVDITQSKLLGKFSALLTWLKEDTSLFTNGTMMTVSDWSTYLKDILESYFGSDISENEPMLIAQIDSLRLASVEFNDVKFPYPSIKKRFESILKKQRVNYRETHLQAIRFCSMLPMRAIPARVIALVGMDEGTFPKQESTGVLNMMVGHSKVDYCPSETDFGRYLFLETLLSARDYFLVSYLHYSASDENEQGPSVLVTELVSYLDNSYKLGSKKFSQTCIWTHPPYPFDKKYFTSNSVFKSYSQRHYREALAFYQIEKKPFRCFLPDFAIKRGFSEQLSEICINLKQLDTFAKNPIKSYFNQTLGMYISDDANKMKIHEDFTISPLDLVKFKKIGLTQPLEVVYKLAEKQGSLPPGMFKTLALSKIENEIELLRNNLQNVDADPQNIFEIEFSEIYSEVRQNANGDWQLPPLLIKGRDGIEIKIVGHFSEVSTKGLIAPIKDDKTDVVKILPQFLIFHVLIEKYALPIEKQLIFSKSGKAKPAYIQDPEESLKNYLEYYLLSLQNISPLIPEWAHDITHRTPEEIKNRMKNSVKDPFNPIYNDYLKWICRGLKLPDAESVAHDWKNQAEQIFSDLFGSWYLTKGGDKNE